jgi:hypothetical protein
MLNNFGLLFYAFFYVKKSRLRGAVFGEVKCLLTELFIVDFSLASKRLTNYPYSLSVINFYLICYMLHTRIFNPKFGS